MILVILNTRVAFVPNSVITPHPFMSWFEYKINIGINTKLVTKIEQQRNISDQFHEKVPERYP